MMEEPRKQELSPADSPPAARSHWGLTMLAGTVLMVLAYPLSPFFVVLLVRLGSPMPPVSVMQALEVFWLPLKWYTESGLPGGEGYNSLLRWLAGSP